MNEQEEQASAMVMLPDTECSSSSRSCSRNRNEEDTDDSVLCVLGSKIVRSGLLRSNASGKVLRFINAGGEDIQIEEDSSIFIQHDQAFEGGDVLRTNETILECGSLSSLYQSVRFGNFCYKFKDFSCGEYFLDLYFAEIINTNGPEGIRVFDIFAQDELVVSKLDVYSYVGANKPLKVMDIRVNVGGDEELEIKFIGVHGTPIVSGICIKEAPKVADTLLFNNLRTKHISKYEKKIEELNIRCQMKTNECYEAWMSLASLNKQLEKVHMELDKKSFENQCLVQAMSLQETKLKDAIHMHDHEKNYWVTTINKLANNIKIMKQEQTKLICEAHECANLVPDMDYMISAIQRQVAQFEDLKQKYNEELLKRKMLYNQVQEAKVDVFADALPMVISVLDGYNVCIFAYGQTGTGKTFTMEGTEHNRGVNYRTLEALFNSVEERKDSFNCNISISVLEVYNEQIRDLLATSRASKKLEVRQASEGSHHVPGIVEAKVENICEVWNALQAGSNARVVGSNNVNDHSSRSHCMICITVKAKNLINGECTKSKLWLVDLAGSERLAKTDVQGDRLKEAQNINRSLSALGDVISALVSKTTHVPYRNSKLTHLLQDSLGGDSKTLMYVQISPSENDTNETICSLNFATRVRGVELGPPKKHVESSELQKLKSSLDKAKQDLRSKDEALKRLEENCHSLEVKVKYKEQVHKSQQEKLDDLAGQLELKAQVCMQLEKQTSLLSDEVKSKQNLCLALQKKIKDFEEKSTQQVQQPLEVAPQTQSFSSEKSHNNSNERKKWSTHPTVEVMSHNQRVLRSSNWLPNHGSVLLRGTESLRELRRKHDAQSRNGVENSFGSTSSVTVSASLFDEKVSATSQIDPSKAFARVTRSTKPFSGVRNIMNKDQGQSVKERAVNTRLWSR